MPSSHLGSPPSSSGFCGFELSAQDGLEGWVEAFISPLPIGAAGKPAPSSPSSSFWLLYLEGKWLVLPALSTQELPVCCFLGSFLPTETESLFIRLNQNITNLKNNWHIYVPSFTYYSVDHPSTWHLSAGGPVSTV